MLTVKEVAARLNVSTGMVYKAVSDNSLNHYRFGASIRISEAQLNLWLEAVENEPSASSPRQTFSHLDL